MPCENELQNARGPGADGSVRVDVDVAAHARSLGCAVEDVLDDAGVDQTRRRTWAPAEFAKDSGRLRLPDSPHHLDRVGRLATDLGAGVAVRARAVRRRQAPPTALALGTLPCS